MLDCKRAYYCRRCYRLLRVETSSVIHVYADHADDDLCEACYNKQFDIKPAVSKPVKYKDDYQTLVNLYGKAAKEPKKCLYCKYGDDGICTLKNIPIRDELAGCDNFIR